METDSSVISDAQSISPNRSHFDNIQLKSPSTQSRLVYYSFFLLAVIFLLFLAGNIYLMASLPITEEKEINPLFAALINFCNNPFVILTGALLWFSSITTFCIWAHRVARNALIMNPNSTHLSTPAKHVFSYFIPIINFYVPYQGMKDIYQTTHLFLTGQNTKTSKIIFNWWSLFWSSVLLSALASMQTQQLERMNENDITQEMISRVLKADITFEIARLAAIGYTVWMVYKISREQMEIIKRNTSANN